MSDALPVYDEEGQFLFEHDAAVAVVRMQFTGGGEIEMARRKALYYADTGMPYLLRFFAPDEADTPEAMGEIGEDCIERGAERLAIDRGACAMYGGHEPMTFLASGTETPPGWWRDQVIRNYDKFREQHGRTS